MIRWADLLWIDDQYATEMGIPEILGDRYLCSMNAVFANIRGAFHTAGFRYLCDASQLCQQYNAYPLLCLDLLIKSGVVPYTNNVSVLRRALKQHGTLAASTDHLIRSLKKNVLLHESSHLIAHRIIDQLDFQTVLSPTEKEQFVVKAYVAEAFANTVECLTAMAADADMHCLFLKLNSYVDYTPQLQELLRRLLRIFDPRSIFRFLFLVFFFQNVHALQVPDRVLESYIELSFDGRDDFIGVREKLLFSLLSQKVFVLDQSFAEESSSLFFTIEHAESARVQFRSRALHRDEIELLGLVSIADRLSEVPLKGLSASVASVDTRLQDA